MGPVATMVWSGLQREELPWLALVTMEESVTMVGKVATMGRMAKGKWPIYQKVTAMAHCVKWSPCQVGTMINGYLKWALW